MDRTHIFKAEAMTLKLRQRGGRSEDRSDFRAFQPRNRQNLNDEEETRLRLEFSAEAKEVCERMTALRAFLVETRYAYMHLCDNLRARIQIMSDEQRNLIDRESEKLFTFYSHQLIRMRAKWLGNEPPRTQRHIHIANILDMLVIYHRSVHNILLQQKQFRAMYDMETYRLVRLGSESEYTTIRIPDMSLDIGMNIQDTIARSTGRPSVFHSSEEDTEYEMNENESDSEYRNVYYIPSRPYHDFKPDSISDFDTESSNSDDSEEEQQMDESEKNNENEENPASVLRQRRHVSEAPSEDNSIPRGKRLSRESHYKSKFFYSDDEDDEEEDLSRNPRRQLNQEKLQMMENENAQLYNEMQGLTEEVEVIERNVADIANLQDVFTEKVSFCC